MPWKCNFWSCLKREVEDVHELDYNHHALKEVPADVFSHERTLEELNLESNRIKDLPRALFHCHGLRVLNLSDNDIKIMPPAIASLINLQHLNLSKNSLSDIPDNIKCCKQLVYVNVSVNPLEKLPEGFTQLIALEELYLNETFLEFLPANFGRLSKLRVLDLRENNLNILPKSIARLSNLQILDIGHNEFSDLPEVIGNLPELMELWTDFNKIRCLPAFIGNLLNLRNIDISNNNVQWVAPEIEDCIHLNFLALSGNELENIPEEIGNLKELTMLKLDDNDLVTLPSTIGKLSRLEELVISQNVIEYLPPTIGLLRRLEILNADDNRLSELPSELCSCSSLRILSVRHNALASMPAEIGHLAGVHVVNVAGNMLRNLPVSVLNLAHLTALWLSTNQATPLTVLQQEVDPRTGQTVCVNFMFPQAEQDARPTRPAPPPEQPSRPHIRFADGAELGRSSRLTRAPTPYPKELRTMAKHARILVTRPQAAHAEREVFEGGLAGETFDEAEARAGGAAIKTATVKASLLEPGVTEQIHCERDPLLGGSKEDLHREEQAGSRETSPLLYADQSALHLHPREDGFTKKEACQPESVTSTDEHHVVLEPVNKVEQQEDDLHSTESVDVKQPPPYHIAAVYSKQAAYFRHSNPANNYNNNQFPHDSSLTQSAVADFIQAKSSPPPILPLPSDYQTIDNLTERFPDENEEEDLEIEKRDEEVEAANEREEDAVINKLQFDEIVIIDNEKKVIADKNLQSFGSFNISNGEQQMEAKVEIPTKDAGSKCRIPVFTAKEPVKPTLVPTLATTLATTVAPTLAPTLATAPAPTLAPTLAPTPAPALAPALTPSTPATVAFSSNKNRSLSKIPSFNSKDTKRTAHSNTSPTRILQPGFHTSSHLPIMHSPNSSLSAFEVNSNEINSISNGDEKITSPTFFKSRIPSLISPSKNSLSSPTSPTWVFGQHKNPTVFPVLLVKNPGLGFSISGGAGASGSDKHDQGIFITKVQPAGPASSSLAPGDKILEVDGIDFSKLEHDQAVGILKQTKNSVNMMISRQK